MFDILIQGGTVVDGTGAPAHRCDVGIIGDTVDAVGMLQNVQALEVIDARGMYLCPGFIDMHGHSDCGLSAAPLLGAARLQRKKTIKPWAQTSAGRILTNLPML